MSDRELEDRVNYLERRLKELEEQYDDNGPWVVYLERSINGHWSYFLMPYSSSYHGLDIKTYPNKRVAIREGKRAAREKNEEEKSE